MDTEPGWYPAQGDPPGTQRFWNGNQWVGDPVASATTAPSSAHGGLASPGARIGARLIDLLIMVVVTLILIWPIVTDLVDAVEALPDDATQTQIQNAIEDVIDDASTTRILLATLATFLYDFLMVAFLGGTLGKLALGLRVANADALQSPPSIDRAFRRALNRLFGLLGGILGAALSTLLGLVGLVSLVLLFADKKHRTVMDFIGQTVVVKK